MFSVVTLKHTKFLLGLAEQSHQYMHFPSQYFEYEHNALSASCLKISLLCCCQEIIFFAHYIFICLCTGEVPTNCFVVLCTLCLPKVQYFVNIITCCY